MKRDDLILWIMVAFLAAAVLFTLLFAPRKSRHGYGALRGGSPVLTHTGILGYR